MSENDRIELPGLKLDWSPRRTEAMLARVQHRLVRRQRAFRAAAAGGLLIGALSAGLFLARPDRATERSSAVPAAPVSSPVAAVTFGDGSTAHPAAASDLRVLEDATTRVRVELVRGSARFAVVPSASRPFEVRAGAVSVTVVGTEFSVERRGEGARVAVTRGKVRVAWGEGDGRSQLPSTGKGSTYLSAGESGTYPPSEPAALATSSPSSASRAHEETPVAQAQRASQLYRAHVARRDYPGAYAVLSKEPGVAGDTVEELLVAADVARLSNHPAQAIPYLERVLRNHSGDERAPMAAFTLGRTLSALGRTREAMNMFGRVRSAWPKSTLGEDALVRQVEAAAKLGDIETAHGLAARYDREFPRGRRRAEVRRYARLD